MADESRPDSLDPGMEESLARFWNALGQGVQPDHAAIDPALVDTVRHVHQLDAAKPPDPAFVQRLRDELFVTGATASSTTTRLNDGFRLNGRDALPVRRPALPARPGPQERRWGLAAGAAAALLLILGIGYVVFGSGLLDDDQRTTVPAAVEPTATPTPGAVWEEIFVELTLPAEALPPGEAGSSLAHFTLPSGARTTWLAPQNAMLAAVLDGTLVVRSGDPIQVLRVADGAWEAVPGGAEATLGPGDVVLLLDVTTAEFDNPGDVPLELLHWGLVSGSETEPPMPPEWVTNDYALSAAGAPSLPGNTGLLSLPGREGMLRLETIIMQPNGSLPAPPEDVLQLVVAVPTDNAVGTPVAPIVARRSDGSVEAFGAQATTLYVITLALAGGAGTPIVNP